MVFAKTLFRHFIFKQDVCVVDVGYPNVGEIGDLGVPEAVAESRSM